MRSEATGAPRPTSTSATGTCSSSRPTPTRGTHRIAHSADGGDTWQVWTIPEPNSVQPDIDSAAPALDTQFVSYLVRDYETNARTLRLARIDLSAS